MKITTSTPGQVDTHRLITDACRVNRGDEGAAIEVLRLVNDSLKALLLAWPEGKGTKFHVVVTVEQEPK